jgi:lysophospholipase L1-like esterase
MKKKWLIIGISALTLLALGVVLYFAVLKPHQPQSDWDKMVTQYREAKYAQYRQENEAYDDYEVEVAFLGDSLTDMYDLQKYYPQYITANRGIGGDTTFDLEKRLQISVYDLKPQVVVMLIGANNPDTMLQNYEDILIGLKTNLPETKIILLSMTAMGGDHWGKHNPMAAYNNVSIKLLAEKYAFTFVDLFTPLYDVSTGEVYEGYTTDGGHFTHEGYTVLTAQITPVLEELLGK